MELWVALCWLWAASGAALFLFADHMPNLPGSIRYVPAGRRQVGAILVLVFLPIAVWLTFWM